MAKKKAKGIAANQSARYRKFIAERDKALELLLNNARAMTHDVLRGAFQSAKEKVAFRMASAPKDSMLVSGSTFLDAVDKDLKTEFNKAINLLASILVRLKLNAYTLAYTGECEAIAQARDKYGRVTLKKDTAIEQAVSNWRGENIAARITLSLDRIRRKILDAVQLSRVAGDGVAETLARVDRALPAGTWVVRPKRALKPIKEADPVRLGTMVSKRQPVDVAMGFIDEEMWQSMVGAYIEEFVPTYRFRVPTGKADADYRYLDEERDLTEDFVHSVRSGQKKAAKDNGIKDMMWIAIIDASTDECCIWRDGLSSSEIEDALKGEHAGDECDVIVPPAHFNCRCTIAPILDTMPESPTIDAKEFEEWLNS